MGLETKNRNRKEGDKGRKCLNIYEQFLFIRHSDLDLDMGELGILIGKESTVQVFSKISLDIKYQ